MFNQIKTAVDRAGGLTMTANQLKVSSVTVHGWIKQGRVPKLDKARHLAKLSKVPVEDLWVGYPSSPYRFGGV